MWASDIEVGITCTPEYAKVVISRVFEIESRGGGAVMK